MNPLLLTDFYKVHHNKMYPEGMTLLYSNFTPRKSRIEGVDKVVFFGLQHFCLEYLIKGFNENFFPSKLEKMSSSMRDGKLLDNGTYKKQDVIKEYSRYIPVDTKHIEALWDLGYLPIEIKAVPEGTLVPIGVPCFTIKNTHPDFAWLTNYLETLISCMMWQPITSATIAYEYKKLLSKYALETTGSSDFVQWQGHDFSMRGLSSVESAILSGMGHLLSFTGTDTIPAIYQLEKSYSANGLIGASVPATEHSVMCMGTKEAEIETFKRLLILYPKDILSVVSDTWNLWDIVKPDGMLSKIKDEILSRDGKLVIRPDSGDPVDILCGVKHYKWNDKLWSLKEGKERSGGYDYEENGITYLRDKEISEAESKGVIELLWDLFGGKINEYGYKELDPHIGAIYGDSITLNRAKEICERLKKKGFASTNVVLGIGSYTYQYNTRDTFGFAMKATYGEVKVENKMSSQGPMIYTEAREIFKDPITDDGTKRSAKGLLAVYQRMGNTTPYLKDQCSWKEEGEGMLETVFKDGKLVKTTTLEEIRKRLNES